MEQDKIRIREVNYIFLATIIVYLVACEVISYLVSEMNIPMTVMGNLILSQMIFIIPTLFYVIRYRINLKEFIRIKPIKLTTVVMLMGFTISMLSFVSLINLISQLFASTATTDAISGGIEQVPWIVSLLVVGVLPSICEESVYRGVFYNEYSKVNVKKAIVLSGFLFGIFHMNINQFAYAFVMGMIFALVIEATDSILASMVCHFTMNASSVILSYRNSANQAVTMNVLEQIRILAPNVIIPTIIAIGLFILIAKNEGRFEHIKSIFRREPSERQSSVKVRLVTVPLVISIIICFGYMVLFEVVAKFNMN